MKSAERHGKQAAIRAHGTRRAAMHLRAPLQPGTLSVPPSAVVSKPPGRKPAGAPSGLVQDLGDLQGRAQPMTRKGGFPFVAPGGANQLGSLTGGPISMVGGSNMAKGGGKKGGNWIKGAIGKPGALHEEMGVPKGKKIPAGKLAKAAKAGGLLGKRARLAETLRGLRHKAAAKGFEGIVDRPTQFLVGEKGPERVRVEPVDRKTAEVETRLMRTMDRFRRAR